MLVDSLKLEIHNSAAHYESNKCLHSFPMCIIKRKRRGYCLFMTTDYTYQYNEILHTK